MRTLDLNINDNVGDNTTLNTEPGVQAVNQTTLSNNLDLKMLSNPLRDL